MLSIKVHRRDQRQRHRMGGVHSLKGSYLLPSSHMPSLSIVWKMQSVSRCVRALSGDIALMVTPNANSLLQP